MKIHLLVLATLAVFASKADSVYADDEVARLSHVSPRREWAAPYIMNSQAPHIMAHPAFPYARHDSTFSAKVGFLSANPDSSSENGIRHFSRLRRRGVLEPIAFVMAFHAVGMAALVSMDPEETGFKPVHVNNWADGMRKPPVWDNDSWITNYILHPLWGSETYLRARSANYTALESFLFSTAASVIWEYGFESWAEHPSKQDLLVTSTVGSLLGEVRYIARQALIEEDQAWATLLLVLVDPLGMFVEYTARLAGHAGAAIASVFTSDVSITPALAGVSNADAGRTMGFQVTVSL